MGKTKIEWSEASWNPTTGCRKVSPGCDNCYACVLAKRLKAMGNRRYQNNGPDGPGLGLTLHLDKLKDPLHWKKPRRIFVNSMSDLFHKDVPDEFIRRVFETMVRCPQHQFQILTKRPRRMATIVRQIQPRPLGNVWLGVSIENDDYVWRAEYLRATPAAIRWLSLEPLLGPLPSLDLTSIGWVVVGGESGTGHRSTSPEWVREIRERCTASSVAFFFKQWGGPFPKSGGRELDGRTWDQYPDTAVKCQMHQRESELRVELSPRMSLSVLDPFDEEGTPCVR